MQVFKDRFTQILQKNKPAFAIEAEPLTEETNQEQEVAKEQEEIPEAKKEKVLPADLNEQERRVAMLLSYEPVHVDDLTGCGLSIGELNATLTMLELKGLIKAMPGKYYCFK